MVLDKDFQRQICQFSVTVGAENYIALNYWFPQAKNNQIIALGSFFK